MPVRAPSPIAARVAALERAPASRSSPSRSRSADLYPELPWRAGALVASVVALVVAIGDVIRPDWATSTTLLLALAAVILSAPAPRCSWSSCGRSPGCSCRACARKPRRGSARTRTSSTASSSGRGGATASCPRRALRAPRRGRRRHRLRRARGGRRVGQRSSRRWCRCCASTAPTTRSWPGSTRSTHSSRRRATRRRRRRERAARRAVRSRSARSRDERPRDRIVAVPARTVRRGPRALAACVALALPALAADVPFLTGRIVDDGEHPVPASSRTSRRCSRRTSRRPATRSSC